MGILGVVWGSFLHLTRAAKKKRAAEKTGGGECCIIFAL
jgi:hypothetical protein